MIAGEAASTTAVEVASAIAGEAASVTAAEAALEVAMVGIAAAVVVLGVVTAAGSGIATGLSTAGRTTTSVEKCKTFSIL